MFVQLTCVVFVSVQILIHKLNENASMDKHRTIVSLMAKSTGIFFQNFKYACIYPKLSINNSFEQIFCVEFYVSNLKLSLSFKTI